MWKKFLIINYAKILKYSKSIKDVDNFIEKFAQYTVVLFSKFVEIWIHKTWKFFSKFWLDVIFRYLIAIIGY